MSRGTTLSALSSRGIAGLISSSNHRVIYAAPGIQAEAAVALAGRAGHLGPRSLTVSLDFDEHTLRMGFGSLDAVKTLLEAGIEPTQSPGFRSGILIVDERGWGFYSYRPLPRKGAPKRRNAECSRTFPLPSHSSRDPLVAGGAQGSSRAGRNAGGSAGDRGHPTGLGIAPVAATQFGEVKAAIDAAPPVKFDVVLQVRVFEPYLQYVELSLSGSAVQRQRVRSPQAPTLGFFDCHHHEFSNIFAESVPGTKRTSSGPGSLEGPWNDLHSTP